MFVFDFYVVSLCCPNTQLNRHKTNPILTLFSGFGAILSALKKKDIKHNFKSIYIYWYMEYNNVIYVACLCLFVSSTWSCTPTFNFLKLKY